jgi:putative transposase
MSRGARILSNTGMYHIMLRGNERKQIFIDNDDKQRMLDIFIDKCQKEKVAIYAYCLMDNHVHLLIGTLNSNLDVVMKRITVSYVCYFNRKYRRIGHLFQDRFRSENIENEGYLLEALRYINNNPVKAGIADSPLKYKWSSFTEYFKDDSRIKDTACKVLEIFSLDREKAKKLLLDFCSSDGQMSFIEYDGNTREEKREMQEEDACKYYSRILSVKGLQTIDLLLKENCVFRDEILKDLKESFSLSIRQISKITGIGRGVVQKIIQNDGSN